MIELKYYIAYANFKNRPAVNRTMIELKFPATRFAQMKASISVNRTMIELKSYDRIILLKIIRTVNRTMIELK